MGGFIQLDSMLLSNFIELNFSENEKLSGEEGDGMKRQNFFSVVAVDHNWFECFCWKFVIG